jgi:hypothetical protein
MNTPYNSPTSIIMSTEFNKDIPTEFNKGIPTEFNKDNPTKIKKPIPIKTVTSNSKPLKIGRNILSNNKKYKIEQYILNQLKEEVFSQEHEIQQYDLHQKEEKKQICCEKKEIKILEEKLNGI